LSTERGFFCLFLGKEQTKTTEQPSQKMRGEPTTSELQALAARQQQQLDTQARLIAAREHRLRQVKQKKNIIT
jgi:hypothetical protein